MKWFNLFRVNLKKEYIELKRYLPNTIAMILTFYFIFLGLFGVIHFFGDPSTQGTNIQFVIVNYVFWFLSLMVIQQIGYDIVNEGMRGTLEQLSMSPMGILRILITRLIANNIIYGIIILILLYVSMFTADQWLNVDIISILPIFIFTVIGMMGLGLIIGGISIILKQVQAILQVLQFLLAALAFIPLAASPIMNFLPFVIGIDLVRDIMIDGATLMELGWMNMILLIINALVYFGIGIFFFNYCERFAMKRGLLGQY
ncbi:ABC transporter permease [Oceanobacillus sp. 1P07AA]|uniref:ABC transporter permease n=1 Tax=Oceanobacillus sp. 1P07AA TaxID=3132293 RepID=UPI0039A785C4